MTAATVYFKFDGSPCSWEERKAELHSHYASNALARGHSADCEKVTAETNWPTIMGASSAPVRGRADDPHQGARREGRSRDRVADALGDLEAYGRIAKRWLTGD